MSRWTIIGDRVFLFKGTIKQLKLQIEKSSRNSPDPEGYLRLYALPAAGQQGAVR